MKECNNENLIDDYLLNQLPEEKKEMFEKHYFNCSHCFEKIEDRNSLIAVIKSKGDKIFHEMHGTGEKRHSSLERVFSFFTPKQWTMAAVSACILLIVVIGILPSLQSPSPQFVLDSQTVRGGSFELISPIQNVQAVPSEFRWDALGENVEYKIYIYKDDLLWSASTTLESISLPEDIKNLLKAGENYSWEVKAFSQEGSLIATSSRVPFHIGSHQ